MAKWEEHGARLEDAKEEQLIGFELANFANRQAEIRVGIKKKRSSAVNKALLRVNYTS